MIRNARLTDLDALASLEEASFRTDRLAARQYRYLLRRGRAALLVADRPGGLVGAAVILFRSGSPLARLYSIAVSRAARGTGVGRALLTAAEQAARREHCVYLRAEVRTANRASRALFESAGYRCFERIEGYYEDGADAVRFEKRLIRRPRPRRRRIPYYPQTLDFTCGSASLLMAMKALDPSFPAGRSQEIRIWREATTVFMTSGHGGCGPHGLALAAHRRGFRAIVQVSRPSGLFVDSVRDPDKKEVIRLVEADFHRDLRAAGVPIRSGRLNARGLSGEMKSGRIPIVLIRSYRMYEETCPHWVVVTGADRAFLYIHDPYVDAERGKTPADSTDIPVRRDDFERMARIGRTGWQAAVFIGPKPGGA